MHAEGRDRLGDTEYRWGADWIAHRGLVYRILVRAPEASWAGYGAPLTGVAASFRPLLSSDRERIVEARLRVVETLRGETLSALLERNAGLWNVEEAAAMNALPENRVLPPRSPVKLALWEAYSPSSR